MYQCVCENFQTTQQVEKQTPFYVGKRSDIFFPNGEAKADEVIIHIGLPNQNWKVFVGSITYAQFTITVPLNISIRRSST